MKTRPRLEYLKNLSYFLTEVRDGTALQELEDELSEAGIPVSSKSKKTKAGKRILPLNPCASASAAMRSPWDATAVRMKC